MSAKYAFASSSEANYLNNLLAKGPSHGGNEPSGAREYYYFDGKTIHIPNESWNYHLGSDPFEALLAQMSLEGRKWSGEDNGQSSIDPCPSLVANAPNSTGHYDQSVDDDVIVTGSTGTQVNPNIPFEGMPNNVGTLEISELALFLRSHFNLLQSQEQPEKVLKASQFLSILDMVSFEVNRTHMNPVDGPIKFAEMSDMMNIEDVSCGKITSALASYLSYQGVDDSFMDSFRARRKLIYKYISQVRTLKQTEMRGNEYHEIRMDNRVRDLQNLMGLDLDAPVEEVEAATRCMDDKKFKLGTWCDEEYRELKAGTWYNAVQRYLLLHRDEREVALFKRLRHDYRVSIGLNGHERINSRSIVP